MATKHDELTEEELAAFQMDTWVRRTIVDLRQHLSDLDPSEINILDWGCGRGRSVARLREKGFNAFGVEIDQRVMSKGFALLKRRGFDPDELLKPIECVEDFAVDRFHLIFSEQVFEHVANLDEVAQLHADLTEDGGWGAHCFPAALNVWEGHLGMPIVHWLGQGESRRRWIKAMLAVGFGPSTPWPGVQGKSRREAAETYADYMATHTYYRDNLRIADVFERHGFDAEIKILGKAGRLYRHLPARLQAVYAIRNGFPAGMSWMTLRRRPR